MFDFKNNYNNGISFISIKEGKLEGCFHYKMGDNYLPIVIEEKYLSYIKNYPNIMLKLMEGEKIYLSSYKIYLGHKQFEGPYGDDEYFVSKYESESLELFELLSRLDKKIYNNEIKYRKLIRIGNFYDERWGNKEMENTVKIALRNDLGEWSIVTKTNTNLCDDVFTNKRSIKRITIEEKKAEKPVFLGESFDAYVFYSKNEYDEEEIAYFIDEVYESTKNQEKDIVIAYYGTTPECNEPGKTAIIKPNGEALVSESEWALDELDMIDLASFMYVQYETFEKNNRDETKKVFK